MSGKRDKNKRLVQAWLNRGEHRTMRRLSHKWGTDKSTTVKKSIASAAKTEGVK